MSNHHFPETFKKINVQHLSNDHSNIPLVSSIPTSTNTITGTDFSGRIVTKFVGLVDRGVIATLTFSETKQHPPIVFLNEIQDTTGNILIIPTNVSTIGFDINLVRGNGTDKTFMMHYFVIEQNFDPIDPL